MAIRGRKPPGTPGGSPRLRLRLHADGMLATLPRQAVLRLLTILMGTGICVQARAAPWTPPPDIQEKPALARDEAELIAVWSDQRDGVLPRIYWTRMTSGPPDTVGARITSATGASEREPAVAAGNGWVLAVWESGEFVGGGIRAAELPPAVSGPLPEAPISLPGLSARRPAVAIGGDVGLVLWEDDSGGAGDLLAAVWEHGAGVSLPGGTPLFNDGIPRHRPRVAAGEAGFVALWTVAPPGEKTRVAAGLLDSTGVLLSSPATLSVPAVDAYASDVMPHGAGFLAVWYQRDQGQLSIAVRELDSSGLPTSAGVVHVSPEGNHRYAPRLALVAGHRALGWVEQSPVGRGVKRGLLAANLTLDPPGGIWVAPEGSFAADMAMSALGESLLVAWRYPLPGDDDDLHAVCVAPADTAQAGASGPLLLVPGEVTGVGPGVMGKARLGAFPNPFPSRVEIRGTPPLEAGEPLWIYDVRGRRVARVEAGIGGRATWNGEEGGGRSSPAGVYFVRGRGSREALRLLRLP